MGKPAQMAAPSSACRSISQQVRKGVVMAAPPLACHSTMKPYFYGVLDIFHRLSQFWSPLLTPFPTGCLFKDNSCPLPGSAFQTLLYSMHDSQPRLGCAGLQHRPCTQFALCPLFDRPSIIVFSFDPLEVSFSSQLISPP